MKRARVKKEKRRMNDNGKESVMKVAEERKGKYVW
jgi:hypothetical protein